MRIFMLNHASVILQHIRTTEFADGGMDLLKADKHPCQCP